MVRLPIYLFFFNDTATTEIYTLSLHDALPIWPLPLAAAACALLLAGLGAGLLVAGDGGDPVRTIAAEVTGDRKSTRLNSSHANISYAVFCLKNIKYCSHRLLP